MTDIIFFTDHLHARLSRVFRECSRSAYGKTQLGYDKSIDHQQALRLSQVSPGIASWLTAFLTNQSVDYKKTLKSSPRKSAYKRFFKFDETPYITVLMSIRKNLAEESPQPWRDEYTLDIHSLISFFNKLDSEGKNEVDNFFVAVIGRTLRECIGIFSNLLSYSQNKINTDDYEDRKCRYTGELSRKSILLNLFSVHLSKTECENENPILSIWGSRSAIEYDDFQQDEDYDAKLNKGISDHEDLKTHLINYPKITAPTLEIAIEKLLKHTPQKEDLKKKFSIMFKDQELLSGELMHDGFQFKSINGYREPNILLETKDLMRTISAMELDNNLTKSIKKYAMDNLEL